MARTKVPLGARLLPPNRVPNSSRLGRGGGGIGAPTAIEWFIAPFTTKGCVGNNLDDHCVQGEPHLTCENQWKEPPLLPIGFCTRVAIGNPHVGRRVMASKRATFFSQPRHDRPEGNLTAVPEADTCVLGERWPTLARLSKPLHKRGQAGGSGWVITLSAIRHGRPKGAVPSMGHRLPCHRAQYPVPCSGNLLKGQKQSVYGRWFLAWNLRPEVALTPRGLQFLTASTPAQELGPV